jgi:hypothetical protein
LVTQQLSKLDKVENKQRNFEIEMTGIRNEITESVKKTEEIMVNIQETTDSMEFGMNVLDSRVNELEKWNRTIKNDIIDLKSRSTRDNCYFQISQKYKVRSNSNTKYFKTIFEK